MSLSGQIRLVMTFMSILVLLIGAVAIVSVMRIQQTNEREVQEHEQLTQPVAHIAVQTLQCRRYEKDMFLNLQDAQVFQNYLVKWTVAVDSLTHSIDIYRNNNYDPKHILMAERWLANVQTYQQIVMNITEEIEQGVIQTPRQANLALVPHKHTVRTLLVSSFDAFNREFLDASAAAQKLHDQTSVNITIVAGMVLLVFVVSVLSLLILPARIANPIKSLAGVAAQLRDGNMQARVHEDVSDNEIGQLGLIFNEMAQRIEQRAAQLEEARKEAESVNEAKTSLLMNMSHELRTPLTSILGFVQCLDEPDTREESIDIITRSGEHLLEIVDDLLQLTEIETQQFKLYGEDVSFKDIIYPVIEKHQNAIIEKELQLILPEDHHLDIKLFTDPAKLAGVLRQILSNAIKFTAEGSIQISCEHFIQEGHIRIEIQDTGMGMSEQMIKQAGTLFWQGDASLTREEGGLGTGFALIKRVLEYLEGSLSIVSELGVGTCMTIQIPLEAKSLTGYQSDSPPSTVQSFLPQPEPFKPRRILVAEDAIDIQKLVGSLLSKIEVDVEMVNNGQEAVNAAMRSRLQEQPFDLILIDMQMPVMNGYDAVRQLRWQGYHYPIVAFTAHAMTGDRQKCMNAGCDDILIKPIDPQSFTRKVQHWLKRPLVHMSS